MPPDRAERVAQIIEDSLELSGIQREAFLRESCAADGEVWREVSSLLGHEGTASAFIEKPLFRIDAEELAATEDDAQRIGRTIGNYKILSLLGEGGMGEVYLAEDLELGRKVALKLIRSGFATRRLIRHFRAEERILAALSHPNIARLYGGGATQDGVPYFVMEYVEGEPVNVHCSKHALSTKLLLQLFQDVCAAVSYAHQRLVIHRDLKPANIRVTLDGEPKLLDFGIAKLLDQDLSGLSEQTMTLRGALTPDYGSPEQTRGETATTATDIYSLGIVLYELLTGAKTSVGHRGRALDRDLENIARRAMHDEPHRRYASVAQLSEDIGRYLAGMPVTARRDTWAYRSAKFVRRNRLGVTAAALMVLLLFGGILATTIEARRAERQRARAEQRFNDVRRLANSLMFEIHDSVQNLQGSTPTRQLIVTRALEFLDSLAQEAGGNATLQRELANGYEKVGDIQGNPYSANLGDTDGALASYRKALAIREPFAREGSSVEAEIELGRSYRGLGDIYEQKGDVAQSINNYRHSLSIFEKVADRAPNEESVQDELARAHETLGDGLARTAASAERTQSYRKTLELRLRLMTRKPSEPKLRRATALAYLKVGDSSITHDADSLRDLRQGTAMLEALATEEPKNAQARREVGMAYYFTGSALTAAGDFKGALAARQQALNIRERNAAYDPKNTQARFDLAVGFGDLCEAYTRTGAADAGFTEGEKSLTILLELTRADSTNAVYQRNLGLCYERLADAKAESARQRHEVAAWTAARVWYQKAHDVFAALQHTGTLMPIDTGETVKFTQRIAECEKEENAAAP